MKAVGEVERGKCLDQHVDGCMIFQAANFVIVTPRCHKVPMKEEREM